jgi:pyrroline-5-carboxylate reductase
MTNASSFKAFTEMGFKTQYKKTTKKISPSGSTKMLAETTRDPPTTLKKEFVSPEGHTVLVEGQRVQIKAARQTTPQTKQLAASNMLHEFDACIRENERQMRARLQL